MKNITAKLACLIVLAGASAQSALADVSEYQEQGKLIRAPQAMTVLGRDLFGDKVNLYTGSLEFVQTDVSLPGNNALPVSLGRRLVTGTTPTNRTSFGRWDMDVPHLHGIFSADGWNVVGNFPQMRCTYFGRPNDAKGAYVNNAPDFYATEFWYGNFLYVPGQGDQEMLHRSAGNVLAPGGNSAQYPVVTRNNWQFSCLPSMAYGGGGEAFLALAPDGTTYRFDWMVSRALVPLRKSNEAGDPMAMLTASSPRTAATTNGGPIPNSLPKEMSTLNRAEVWILPTVVTDRFGNTVTYTYDQTNRWQLKSIVANDASGSPRRLDLTYAAPDSPLVETVSDGTRTWRYTYTNTSATAELASVSLPDNSAWQLGGLYSLVRAIDYASAGSCEDGGTVASLPISGFLIHPSGARGDFTLTPTRHGRSGVPKDCAFSGDAGEQIGRYPTSFDTFAVTQKKITGPGLSPLVWTTTYPQPEPSWAPCNGCVSTATVTVEDPEGTVTRHTFGTLFHENEGLLQQTDIVDKHGALARTTRIFYAEPIPPLGNSDQGRGDGIQGTRVLETSSRVIEQQGATFSWQATAFDQYARPIDITRSSSLGYSRREATTYSDDTAKWVLGQIAKVTESTTGLVPVLNQYNPVTACLERVTRFGKLQQSFAYNADGTLATKKDAAGNATTYSNYKRGIAQAVKYADGTTESATVDNIGLIRTVTDALGYTTTYDYDAIGRLKSVTYPGKDSVTWNPTTIVYSQSPASEYGLAPGHWREEVATGNAVETTYYDAMWRPVVSERWDRADRNGTVRTTRRLFDSAGRKTFESYPTRGYDPYSDGVYQEYDGLGRPTVTSTISELGTLYSGFYYADGFTKAFTDARGNSHWYSYQAFDEPDETAIVNIGMPEGVNVAITRDVFGKPKSITRAGNGKSATRSYVYDGAQRLCKMIEPETSSTVQDYDLAGNVLWRAPGQALPSASCDTKSVPDAKKIVYGYDKLNRLTTTTFGDGSLSITKTYWPDGLPRTIASGLTTWTYEYNRRRLLESESLSYGGATYGFFRRYDANGSLARVLYPQETAWLEYSPNALGEPRQVGNYATQITYHPNGAVSSFYYGNGVLHTMTQNRRGLPQWSQDAGILKDQYSYDANGNVTSIADWQEGITNRGLEYDKLNRLLRVNDVGVWGDAWYTYDALDNLISSRLTAGANARTLTHNINPATNLLDSITNSAGSAYNLTFQYDERGNLKQRGAQSFTFDLGNRMKSAAGKGTYLYDGLGRRVSAIGPNGVNKVTVYSQDGRLLYAKATNATVGTRYIHLHNHVIAEVTGNTVQYDHTDGLGSPVALSNSTGKLIGRTRYEPYGATAAGLTPTVGYTGHLNAPDLGLVYMQQRYYDPVAGRFLSIDPVVTDANTGGSFNRYVYASNSPYKYIDPDGRQEHAAEAFSEQFRKDAAAGNSEVYKPFVFPAAVVTGAMLVGAPIAAAVIAGAPAEATVAAGGAAAKGVSIAAKEAAVVSKAESSIVQVNPKNLIPTQAKSEMTGSQINKLARDMQKNGFDQTKPIYGQTNARGRIEIVDGHHRAAAAIKAGIEKVPVDVYTP